MNLFTQMLRLVDRFSVEFKSVRAAIAATYGSFLVFYAKYALGISLYAWGDSYNIRRGDPILPTTFTGALHYLDRLQTRLGLSEIGSLAVGGYTSCMTAAQLLTGLPIDADGNPRVPGGLWPFNWRAPVIFDIGKNDIYYGGMRPRSLEGVRQAYNTILAVTSSGAIYGDNDVSVAYSGTPWTIRYDVNFHHGGKAYKGSAGSVVTVTLPGPGVYWLLSSATDDDALGVSTCDFSVSIDGSEPDIWVLSNQMRETRSHQKLVPAVHKVEVVGAGEHVVELTAFDGNFAIFNGYLKKTPTPPPVLFSKQLTFSEEAMASWTYLGGGNTQGAASIDAVNAIIDDICPDFPNVTVVDARPGWNPAIHIGFDKLHPTDLGEEHLANAYEAVMLEALTKGTYLVGPTQPPAITTANSGTPAPYPPPSVGPDLGVAVSDTFNRTGSHLGSTDVGLAPIAWDIRAGDFGIRNGQAYCSAAGASPFGFSMATIDCGGKDGHIAISLKTNGGPQYSGFVVHYTDGNNFVVGGLGGLTVFVAGQPTTFPFSPPLPNADVILDVYLNEDSIAVSLGGTIICAAGLPTNLPRSTDHGFVWYGPSGLGGIDWFDYLLTNAPSVAGDITGGGGGDNGGGGTEEPSDVVLIEDHFSGGDGSSLQPLVGPMPQVLSGTVQVKDNALLVEGMLKYDLDTNDYKVTVVFKTAPVSDAVLHLRYTNSFNSIFIQLVNGNCGQFVNGEYRYIGNIGAVTVDSSITSTVSNTTVSFARAGYPTVSGAAQVPAGDIVLAGGVGTKYDDLYVVAP